MSKLNTFAYIQHFYQSGSPFYDDALVQVKSRNLEDIPLDGVYKFRLFDSELGFDKVDGIIQGIKYSDDAIAISELIEQTNELTHDVCKKIDQNGNRDLADKLADTRAPMQDLYYGLISMENLANYNELINLTRWFLIGDQISEEERQRRIEFFKSLGSKREKQVQLLSSSRIISSGINGDSHLHFPDDPRENVGDVYPSVIRARSLVRIRDIELKEWY